MDLWVIQIVQNLVTQEPILTCFTGTIVRMGEAETPVPFASSPLPPRTIVRIGEAETPVPFASFASSPLPPRTIVRIGEAETPVPFAPLLLCFVFVLIWKDFGWMEENCALDMTF